MAPFYSLTLNRYGGNINTVMTGTEPTTTNFLSPLGHRFFIKKIPTVNFFVQNVAIPSITMGETPVPTPFTKIQLPGDQATYGDLVITFRVDENLDNYMELYNWMRAILRVDDFTESTAWVNEANNPMSDDRVFSDATLTILNSAMNPNKEVTFTDCFPTSLSDIPFSTQLADVDYVECTATFKYRKFEIENI